MTASPPITPAAQRHLAFFTLAGLLVFAPVFWMYFWTVGAADVSHFPLGRDFINVWMGSRLAAHAIMTLFDYGAYFDALKDAFGPETPFHNWGYPPTLLFLTQPLGWLPYWAALLIWTVLGFAIYAVVVVRQLAPSARMLGFALLLLAPATIVNVVTGQNGFYSAALLLGGIVALERRPVLAGVLFGLLTMKPHLGVLMPLALVMIGAWRTIAVAALTAVLFTVPSLVQWGIDPWLGWLTKSSAVARFYLDTFHGFYTYMMPSVYAGARVFGLSFAWASAVQAVATLMVAGATALAFRRTSDAHMRALLITSGTLLATPYAFNYDATTLTGAMLWAMAGMPAFAARERVVFGLAWIVPVLVWPLHLSGIGLTPLIIAGIFILTVMRILRSSRAEAAPLRIDEKQPVVLATPVLAS
jgi:hypothetical protein